MTYAYLRVSSKDQNLARQIVAIKNYRPNILDENIRYDKQSGKNFCRDEYIKLKALLQPGDELIIKELDRFGRNKEEIKEELRALKEQKIIVRIFNVPTTLIDYQGQDWIFDMVNNILIEVLGAMAEEERHTSKARQREGINCMPVINGKRTSAKTNRPMGRPNLTVGDSEFQKIFQKQKDGLITVSEAIKVFDISRSSWYNLVRKNCQNT